MGRGNSWEGGGGGGGGRGGRGGAGPLLLGDSDALARVLPSDERPEPGLGLVGVPAGPPDVVFAHCPWAPLLPLEDLPHVAREELCAGLRLDAARGVSA